MSKIIAQGAEAIITKNKNTITKNRVKKSYRLLELDKKIRKSRTKREVKILQLAQNLIPVPKMKKSTGFSIEMQFIPGKKLSEYLENLKNSKEICRIIGKQVAILHDNNIIHGDLTTSNMILSKDKVFFIDFGLSYISSKPEDKAVDLHLIKQALEAKHYKTHKILFSELLKGYKLSKNAGQILKRLEKVELRGRYKQQY